MLVKEYRIPMPFSRDEYQIGQLFTVLESSKSETGAGEGVEILVNQPFEDENGKGQFTHKIYHLSSKVPAVIRVLAPSGALEIHERSWNAFPFCKTVMTSAFMKDSFQLVVESRHSDGEVSAIENIHNLDEKLLKKREIISINIAEDPDHKPSHKNYKAIEDPRHFQSEKTKRGPLREGWEKQVNPVMTCYKLVTVEFKWFGLQGKIESFIQQIIEGVFRKFHRQLFCWMDNWIGLSMEDIRRIEEQAKKELDEKRATGHTEEKSPNSFQHDEKHNRAATVQ